MKKMISVLFAGGIVSCLLASCMSARNASWSNPEFPERKLGKTIVMAIGESEYRVNQFEALLVRELATYGVAAQAMHQLCPTVGDMEREQISALVQSNRFDSIVVTHVLSEDDRQQLVATGYTSSPNMGYSGVGYWGYGMSYSLNPEFATVSNTTTYDLETNLFDVPSKKLVWSGRKEVFDGDSDIKNIQKVVISVIRGFKSNKML
ncbi:hypothetical protein PDESU_02788 [Pontiella desulfatans]|uniref:DUF4136 domain-containing protein n=1 Tax=Pontiella desulfatans TaxID=2750659 RepID=A0A6C2U357_PONDE|nr:DUF4136 domain-containing protein [Pontiella desulfatans]VGO14229.1 hypothetical protein PDESU_02788 [Pontiella desulfatans]